MCLCVRGFPSHSLPDAERYAYPGGVFLLCGQEGRAGCGWMWMGGGKVEGGVEKKRWDLHLVPIGLMALL